MLRCSWLLWIRSVHELACPVQQVARTETCSMTSNPEFLNRVFVMRLPEALGTQPSPHFSLQCSLFATPTMQGPAGPMVAGQEVDELMGAATLQVMSVKCTQ